MYIKKYYLILDDDGKPVYPKDLIWLVGAFEQPVANKDFY